ncbi:MAG TPA: hypothetical protein VH763_19970 [Gemmatimonadales bacterium]|jgi:hypothetical protein
MFLGHYGLAFALKRVEPKVSLGTLFIAVVLADLLWGCFLLLGWEHVRIIPEAIGRTPFDFYDYPLSHSLLACLLWGVAVAAIYYSWPTRDTSRHWQTAALVGAAVASHWPLDLLVHAPDLPLAGEDSAKFGLGLWAHPTVSMIVEILTLCAGLALYVAWRSRRHPARPVRLSLVVSLLLAVYLAGELGPPPPSVTLVALGDIVFILLLGGLGAWADRPASPAELAAAGLSPR